MDALLGMIMTFGGNFAPAKWLPCDGRLLQIREATPLFSIVGTTYGGDGKATFALPKIAPPVAGAIVCICVDGIFPSRP